MVCHSCIGLFIILISPIIAMTEKQIRRIRGVIQGKRRGYQKNPKKMQGHFLEQPEGEENPHKPLGKLDCDSR